MAVNGDKPGTTDETAPAKPKRTRSGCLTCRERHLKCDEATPICNNCRRSNRDCKYGIKTNFIDTQCVAPPVIADSGEWFVHFEDESRKIAGEYVGGAQRYPIPKQQPPPAGNNHHDMMFGMANQHAAMPAMMQQSLPNLQGHPQEYQSMNLFEQPEDFQHTHHTMSDNSPFSVTGMPTRQNAFDPQSLTSPKQSEDSQQDLLSNRDETFYMQVFCEEVGVWMDSMDSMKHFSKLLPFHALREPMLLNAFFACGSRHLTLVNPETYRDDKARAYYDKASGYLFTALQNPNRNSVICAITAVILNVYEIMTEKATPRMSHIAGARALIKECRWDAKSTGVGAACFWLNVGMELLSNLHFKWQSAWHPDSWGVDLDFQPEREQGREEHWTRRMVYITAKVGDFRVKTEYRKISADDPNALKHQHDRVMEWNYLKSLVDAWDSNSPRSMKPMAYLHSYQSKTKSAFPEPWLIDRAAMVARLFYHTALCLLSQIHPAAQGTPLEAEMNQMKMTQAQQICGITAHTFDRGVSSVALRSLAIAAECLTNRNEQEEVLQIFTRIHRDTGWRIGFIPQDLCAKWGWDPSAMLKLPTHANPLQNHSMVSSGPPGASSTLVHSKLQFDQYAETQKRLQEKQAQLAVAQQRSGSFSQTTPPLPSPARMKPPGGMVNPLFKEADFANEKHPYMEYYVPTSQQAQQFARGAEQLGLPPFSSTQGNGSYGFSH